MPPSTNTTKPKKKVSFSAASVQPHVPDSVSLFYVPVSIQLPRKTIQSFALLDIGASANFISSDLVTQYDIPASSLPESVPLNLADGSSATPVSQFAPSLSLTIGNHSELTSLMITRTSHPLVLGLPWFQTHNPSVHFRNHTLSFSSCPDSCTISSSAPVVLLPAPQLDASVPETLSVCLASVSPSSPVSELPAEYLDFADVFDENRSHALPPHRQCDLEIRLVDPSLPLPYKPLYNLSRTETQALKDWIDVSLSRGHIRPSQSSAGAPVFFVKKKDGGLRPCVDYRELNSNTVRDRFPLPLISQILDRLSGANWFTTLDLKGAYNLVRIKEGCEHLAAFRTPFGLFEPLVIPFGLTNAPSVFQRFINQIFSDLLDVQVIIYLDDLLIFSKTREEHVQAVHSVLARLREHSLVATLPKCHFNQQSVSFLGYIISDTGIRMCPSKTAAVTDWPVPSSVTAVQSFVGFVNFYRRFIDHFSTRVAPLVALTRKDVPFLWSSTCQSAFDDLKHVICSDVILPHPNPDIPFTLETDASDIALGAVLSQPDASGNHRPVSFYSRSLLPAERNYTVHDRELLAIVRALRHWRHHLQGSAFPTTIFCDHKNLLFFRTSQRLKPRHARWAETLSEYNFVLQFIPGAQNTSADALSRIAVPEKGDSQPPTNYNRNEITILPDHLWANRLETAGTEWPEYIRRFLLNDCWPEEVKDTRFLEKQLTNFSLFDETLQYQTDKHGKVPYLPVLERAKTFARFHDNLGHLATSSVYPLLQRRYWWPTMRKDLVTYVARCPRCQLNKSPHHSTVTDQKQPTRPVPPVALPFERFGIDFVQNLALTKRGNRHILTCIDYATRWVIARAVPEMTSAAVISFLYEEILLKFGAPYEIISDRGSSFLSEAVAEFERLHGIQHRATSPYHPCTNGLVERMHSMLGHSITTLSDSHPERWDEYLNQALFALRVRTHAVTGYSPFYLLYGVEPRLPGDTAPPPETMVPLDELERKEAIADFTARNLDELGQHRAAAYQLSVAQALRMTERTKDLNDAPAHYFSVGDMVKMKHHDKRKFEYSWRGPYHVIALGHPGTYQLMDPSGRQLDTPINQRDLAPWLAATIDNEDFFYDGTSHISSEPAPLTTLAAPVKMNESVNQRIKLGKDGKVFLEKGDSVII
jgi:transposase InsO family protein